MKKSALLTLFVAGSALCFSESAFAQNAKTTKPASKQPTTKTAAKPATKPTTKPAAKGAAGFTTTETGLQYKIVKHGTGKRNPALGDHLEMHIKVHIKDSVLFDSRKMNNNKPVPFQVQKPTFKGDPIEGFMKLVAGDSALLKLPVDSILNQTKQVMPGMKPGDLLEYEVVLLSVMSDDEFKAEQTKKLELQKTIDDVKISDYLTKNNIKAQKTASGLYYTVSTEGTGNLAKNGQTVKVNYTGRILGSNEAFDSNTDPKFSHVEPFGVELGTGSVIKGWDEGLALLKKGSKATFYIPSGLAYGSQDRSPQIPANSVLVFDVEVVDITTQAEADEKALQEYFTKNKIQPQKTASGIYYKIIKEGTGEKPKEGEKVSVSYKGTTLDGNKFDANVDSNFVCNRPFSFPLGKGQVIKGWDEGIGLLKKGTRAMLYIPSTLAYGRRSPTAAIPPNSCLVFEVELTNIEK